MSVSISEILFAGIINKTDYCQLLVTLSLLYRHLVIATSDKTAKPSATHMTATVFTGIVTWYPRRPVESVNDSWRKKQFVPRWRGSLH